MIKDKKIELQFKTIQRLRDDNLRLNSEIEELKQKLQEQCKIIEAAKKFKDEHQKVLSSLNDAKERYNQALRDMTETKKRYRKEFEGALKWVR